MREREAEDVRATAMGFYQAYAAAKGGKKGGQIFAKWLDSLA